MATIAAIWIKRFKGGPMDPAMFAELVAGRGLRGNANQGGKRQVTLIAEESWRDAETALATSVHPSTRRANVMLRGIDLEQSRGRILHIGDTRLRIYGETRPCHQMDEAVRGLRAALSPAWRGGAFAEVLDGGVIRVGDEAAWEE